MSRLLIDTHALLWFAAGDRQLSTSAREGIADPANNVFVSHASVWEMAIKMSLGKLRLDRELARWLNRYAAGNGFDFLPISLSHLTEVAGLPHHHGDPFDRLLVTQCVLENMPLVSRDPVFDAYGIKRVW
ncbi:MAG: type II toxin-antitoxin system VapC family toxin [Opitutaceae bacterium]|nr:type II toxin-antitoxin system VapC family toxin [Opitutaceae bacterium]